MMSSKKRMPMTLTMMDIPNDVMIEIISRLPVQSLLRFRWICKSWFNLIRDPTFVNMQLNNYNNINHNTSNNNPLVLIYSCIHDKLKLNSYNIMDIGDDHTSLCPNSFVLAKLPASVKPMNNLKILGSCKGLLCMGVGQSSFICERYFIWNPCTKEYRLVNDILTGTGHYYYSRYGFGYDRTIDDYKLVLTANYRNNAGPETCVVYTLGTNSWKTVRSSYQFILCSTTQTLDNVSGLFISGYLYYTAKEKSSSTIDIIVSYDIAKEEYRQIAMPVMYKDGLPHLHTVLKLGELKGCLCLLGSEVGFWEIAEVWVMRHNEEYTWEKLCTISVKRRWESLCTKFLRLCKNGEISMAIEDWISNKKIVLYDPKSGKTSTALLEVSYDENVENYIESLVSLNSGTYMMVPAYNL